MTLGLSISVSPDTTVPGGQPLQFVSAESYLVPGETADIATLATSRPATLSITGGADQALFSLAGATLSFAAPPTADGTYAVEITASDGSGGSETLALTVTVDATAPAFTSPATYALASGAATVGTLAADEPATFTLEPFAFADPAEPWRGGPSADAALFDLTGAALSFAAGPAGEGVHRVTVAAADAVANRTVQDIEVEVAPQDTSGDADEVHFFLFAGQSNMEGRGFVDHLPAPLAYPAGVKALSGTSLVDPVVSDGVLDAGSTGGHDRLSVPLGFARDYMRLHPDVTLVLAHEAAGGTGFDNAGNWVPGGDRYDAAVAKANAAQSAIASAFPGKTAVFKGIVWLQGEADDHLGEAAYAAYLDDMIAAMRNDIAWADASTPFVAIEISRLVPSHAAVRAALAALPGRMAHTGFVSSENACPNAAGNDPDSGTQDSLHFGASGLLLLGGRTLGALERARANDSLADVTAPTITAPATVSLANGATTVGTLTASESVTWSITGGADQALFTLAGAVLSFASAQTAAGSYQVRVRATDAAANHAEQTITVTVAAADTTPDPFALTDVTDADVSTAYTSDTITVSGIDAATPVSISGGSYRINAGAFIAAAGTVQNGDTVAVRVTSAAASEETVEAVLTIGGISDTFSVTTKAAAPSGDAEAGALGHWFFGTDNTGMTDMIAGAALTPLRIAPTHAAGHLALGSDGTGVNGLATPFDDADDLTFIAVVRQADAAHQCVVGPTFGDDSGYGTFFNGSQGLKTNGRAGSGFVNATLDGNTDLSPSTWIFVAVSASAGTAPANVAFAGDTTGGHKVVTASALNAATAGKVALGSAHYTTGTFADPMEVAELIVFDSHKTEAEIEAIYARSRTRLAARGITVR